MSRSTLFTAVTTAALTLGGAVAAQAHEFKPAWGYAYIDDAPFNEPGGGALLASTRVFPRGYIRDVAVDHRDVRMTVHVFTPGKADAEYSYPVNEGDFKNFPIDRRIDIAPLEVSYLAYDFCRFNPANGVVEVCEERYRIGRPAAPAPSRRRRPRPTRVAAHRCPRHRSTPTATATRSPPTARTERHRPSWGARDPRQRDRRRLRRRRRPRPA